MFKFLEIFRKKEAAHLEVKKNDSRICVDIYGELGLTYPVTLENLESLRSLSRHVDTAFTQGLYSDDHLVRLKDVTIEGQNVPEIGYTTALSDCVSITVVDKKIERSEIYSDRRMTHLRGGRYQDRHIDDLFYGLREDAMITVAFGSSWGEDGKLDSKEYLNLLMAEIDKKNISRDKVSVVFTDGNFALFPDGSVIEPKDISRLTTRPVTPDWFKSGNQKKSSKKKRFNIITIRKK